MLPRRCKEEYFFIPFHILTSSQMVLIAYFSQCRYHRMYNVKKPLPNFSHALHYESWAMLLTETLEGIPAHFPRNVSASLSISLVTL